MADVKFLANIDLNDNQLLNMKLQHLSSDPTGVEGQLFYHSGSNVVKFYDGSNWVSLSSATGDISGVTAGDGLSGGGSSGAVTLAVNVDDSSIETSSDAIRVKALGITNAMLAGSIASSKLAGSIADSKLSTITTANKVNIGALDIDGATDIGAALVDADLFIVDDGANGTERKATMSRLKTYMQNNLTFTTNTNTQLSTEQVQDIVGGMVTGNTESGITVTYQDTDGTIDFTVGTLNQDTTGNAATATALETARTIGGVSFDGSANISLVSGSIPNNAADTTGNAATATKIASITNSNIVQLTASQTLTNKTIAASQVTEISNITASEGAQIENINSTTISATQWGYLGAATGAITNTDVSVSAGNLKSTLGGVFSGSALAIGTSAETVTVKGDFVVDGSITLKGDTVLESTTNTAIKDKILLLNQGASGANTNDLAVLWSRGSGTTNGEANVALKWDEGDAEFHLICTTATGAEANGAIDPAGSGEDGAGTEGFQNLRIAKLTATSFGMDGNTISGIDDSGEFTDNDQHIMTSAAINDRFAVINANTTGSSGSTTGNAATATALATARTIGGVSFDGTANINLPGVNSAGNQNTSGSAATLTTARTINGTSFNGSANITVTAAGSTLTGTSLKSTIVTSSLTSVGTLSSGNATAIVSAASTSAAGKVELATTAEALAGTDSSRAVTAAGLAARSYRTAIGNGSATSYTVNHALGTRDVVVQMYDASSYETCYAQVVRTDTANVTIDFNVAPTTNDIIVLVTKID
jgi:hypothetical protein